MPDQPTLFPEDNPGDAERARNEAMRRAEKAASEYWKSCAREAIRKVCEAKEDFTTDDVWAILGSPREPRALGPIMNWAERAEFCQKIKNRTRNSRRKACHARPLQVWESLLWKGRSHE